MVFGKSQGRCLVGAQCTTFSGICAHHHIYKRIILPFLSLLICFCVEVKSSSATPETWFAPVITATGSTSSSFGSAVACSSEVGGLGHSWFAVGAPDESSAQGRVHIMKPSGVTQVLQAPTPNNSYKFGSFLSFIGDINGDSYEDLVVGEPNNSGVAGNIYVFVSNGSSTTPFTYCGSQTGAASFGSSILATSNYLLGTAEIVVSTPASFLVESFDVTHNLGSCNINATATYQSTGVAASRYGQSISEIDAGVSPAVNIQLLIGSPVGDGTLWRVPALAAPVDEILGVQQQGLGVAVASKATSNLFGYLAPYTASPGNTVYVKSHAGAVLSNYCELPILMDDLPDTSSQSLAHLNQVFGAFLGVTTGATFCSYRDEAITGGSVALFGAEASNCTAPKQINNCQYDANQLQGIALAGGISCVTTGGAKLLMVGSPGFAGNSGRVDIYAEGTQSSAATPCPTPTFTFTPTPTFTATPIETPLSEPTATAEPAVTDTPLAVDPSTRNLPPPEVVLNGRNITMSIPPAIKGPGLVNFLRKIFNLTRRQAVAAAASTRLRISWIVKRIGGTVVAAAEQEALSSDSKKREIQTRRNMVSLRNLSPGTYAASYRFVFYVQSPRKTTIMGRTSSKATFNVR
jgi:hypothetical protein